jgi:hypothetical protein
VREGAQRELDLIEASFIPKHSESPMSFVNDLFYNTLFNITETFPSLEGPLQLHLAPPAPELTPHVQLDQYFHQYLHFDLENFHFDHDALTGDPAGDARWWNHQAADDTCAVVAQQGILESLLHHDVSQDEIVRVAEEHGWYHPGEGTLLEDMGNVIEAYGIPVERGYEYSISDLYNALHDGHKVMVGLDPNEIWFPQSGPDGLPVDQFGSAGHAVWVTGITTDDHGNLCVTVNDSGKPDGCHNLVPVDDFLNAWEDYANFAVITHEEKAQLA